MFIAHFVLHLRVFVTSAQFGLRAMPPFQLQMPKSHRNRFRGAIEQNITVQSLLFVNTHDSPNVTSIEKRKITATEHADGTANFNSFTSTA